MGISLEARLQRLEQGAADSALCTDPRCQHMGFVRVVRMRDGLPTYPLPAHPRIPKSPRRGAFADLLLALNRQSETRAANDAANQGT